MGRREGRFLQPLEVKVPSLFRCPISLEVMRSPVSLCTGVTYDRASIQRWLDSGNATCPATMQPLPSTELVPNLTLRRLINLWSTSTVATTTGATNLAGKFTGSDVVPDLSGVGGADPVPVLSRLCEFFGDADVDEFEKNSLIGRSGFVSNLVLLVLDSRSSKASVRLISILFESDCIDEGNKNSLVSGLKSKLEPSVSALVNLLKNAKSDCRIRAGLVLENLIKSCEAESKVLMVENSDLLPELVRLINGGRATDRVSAEVGLKCLIEFSTVRRLRIKMVEAGLIPAAAKVLISAATTSADADKALQLLEFSAGCAEGRSVICRNATTVLGPIVDKMMKVGKEGREAAAATLWSVCHLFADRRAQEAVAATEGGLTKILLVMQSDCSPAVRQMAGDLLKIFRVNSKSCLPKYDTKTTHIMPF